MLTPQVTETVRNGVRVNGSDVRIVRAANSRGRIATLAPRQTEPCVDASGRRI